MELYGTRSQGLLQQLLDAVKSVASFSVVAAVDYQVYFHIPTKSPTSRSWETIFVFCGTLFVLSR